VAGNPLHRKALAMAIYLKDHNTPSVFKDWTYRDLARAAHLHPATVKRYLRALKDLHLVREEVISGHRCLLFKKFRRSKVRNRKNDLYHTPKSADIALSKIDKTSVNAIEKSLMSIFISEDTARKDYYRRLIQLSTNPTQRDSSKEVKRAKAVCRKRGLEEFKGGGLSYKGIAKGLHCGLNTVRRIIGLGETLGMFWVEKRELVLVKYIGGCNAKHALEFFKGEFPTAFATSNNIYQQPVLIFHSNQER